MRGGNFGEDKLKKSSNPDFLPGRAGATFVMGVPDRDAERGASLGKYLPDGATTFTEGVSDRTATARSMGRFLPGGERGHVKGA